MINLTIKSWDSQDPKELFSLSFSLSLPLCNARNRPGLTTRKSSWAMRRLWGAACFFLPFHFFSFLSSSLLPLLNSHSLAHKGTIERTRRDLRHTTVLIKSIVIVIEGKSIIGVYIGHALKNKLYRPTLQIHVHQC